MEKQYSLKNPLKQTPYEILKGVLFKIVKNIPSTWNYATNPAPFQENLANLPRFCWRFEKYTFQIQ